MGPSKARYVCTWEPRKKKKAEAKNWPDPPWRDSDSVELCLSFDHHLYADEMEFAWDEEESEDDEDEEHHHLVVSKVKSASKNRSLLAKIGACLPGREPVFHIGA